MRALSIRQPWAWLIVNGHKDIENRSWPTRYTGPILVHASRGMTRAEYDIAADCTESFAEAGVKLPAFDALERGGIVGLVTILDCLEDSLSPWFFGRYGFVLDNARPLPFIPMKGQLGFWDVPYAP